VRDGPALFLGDLGALLPLLDVRHDLALLVEDLLALALVVHLARLLVDLLALLLLFDAKTGLALLLVTRLAFLHK
jgi:hypothetical protein